MKKIDIHAHYGYWPFPILAETEADIQRMLREHEIEKCVLSSAKAVQYDFIAGNQELVPVLERNPELFGYITLNPNYLKESEQELEKYSGHPKFIGVKIHPSYVGLAIDAEATTACIKLAEQAQLPLLIHTFNGGDTAPSRILNVRKRCPTIPIIMAHMGGNNWQEAINVAAEADKVYLDVVCSLYTYNKVRVALDRVGVNRLVFGTDLTLIHPAVAIGMFEGAGLTELEKQQVYYLNATKLFPKLASAK